MIKNQFVGNKSLLKIHEQCDGLTLDECYHRVVDDLQVRISEIIQCGGGSLTQGL